MADALSERPLAPASGRAPFWYRLTNSEAVLALLCIGPATLLLLAILAYPVLQSLGLAFYEQNLSKPELGTRFVGLDNCVWLLDYERFWLALQHSVVLTAATVVLELVIGMAVALMLTEPFRGTASCAACSSCPGPSRRS
jgi:ABC-type sugar transport system permease subunit